MKFMVPIAAALLATHFPTQSSALESCQADETTIVDGTCFIDNKCYEDGDERQSQDSVLSNCQLCDSGQSQTIWSVKSGFSASTAEPPNDCSEIPTDTFQSCTVPEFGWATYSTRTTARMYAMKGAVSGNYVYAAGYLKSNIDIGDDTAVETAEDFTVSGPYTTSDPMGNNAKEISVDLMSYAASDGARENAGGSFGQYEVGIVKIDATSGDPLDVFVYGGQGLDETSGLAALDDMIAISGHFTGNLTVELMDGTSKTIFNSNLMENGMPNQDDQYHPNSKDGAGETGSDDGFVIKADAETGKAEWIVHYPISNKDAQIVGVDMDTDGNVYGSGYKCSTEGGDSIAPKVCDGIIVKFDATDGSVMWETVLSDHGAAFWIKYDASDDALYYTGTTTYGGTSKDSKGHNGCDSESCAVTGRMSASTGDIQWVRTVAGSPRWGVFDQSGDIELASDSDGPFIYVAFDDVGEGGPVSLDSGTSYAGCKDDASGEITPEYEVSTEKQILSSDCPDGTTFVNSTDEEALPSSSAQTGAHCGSRAGSDACLIKFHKYTGLPIWGVDLPPIAGIVPSPDGSSIMVAGWYYNSRGLASFDSVTLPGYLREDGLATQKSGIYNTALSTEDGKGEYVLHSGGGSKDRLYDLVGDGSGNVYNIGYSMNLVMNWGGSLKTTMTEADVNESEAKADADETHFFVSKLDMSKAPVVPSCLSSCDDGNIAGVTIEENSCFIDSVCYASGETAELFGKICFACNPNVSQTDWTVREDVVGVTHCFVDDICVEEGGFKWSQRRTWAAKTFSACQVCDITNDAYGWTIVDGYSVPDSKILPPTDCVADSDENNDGDGGDGEDDGGDGDREDGGGYCFSGLSIVKLEDETMIPMRDLKIGDRVQVTEDGKFDTVYSFGHYQPDSIAEYLSIQSTAKAAPITISAPHMLFLDSRKAVPASSIKVGDILLGGKIVTKVENAAVLGAYAPFTYSGTIIVNGVVASNYVSLTGTSTFLGIDMQFIAHTAVAARRALCQLNLCEEKYSDEGIATWIPYRTAAWIAAQEVGIGFLTIAAGVIAFARRRQKALL